MILRIIIVISIVLSNYSCASIETLYKFKDSEYIVVAKKSNFSGIEHIEIVFNDLKYNISSTHTFECYKSHDYLDYFMVIDDGKVMEKYYAITDTLSFKYFEKVREVPQIYSQRSFRSILSIEKKVLRDIVTDKNCRSFAESGKSTDEIIGFIQTSVTEN